MAGSDFKSCDGLVFGVHKITGNIMGRYDDIDPQDIDPDTGKPYPNYSSPALDTTEHDAEMDVDDDGAET